MRRAVTIAYSKSALNPLITSKETYLTTFRAKAKDDAIKNAQKIMLEDRLNKDFDINGGSPIYIITFVDNLDTNYFYNLDEVNPPPIYMFFEAEAPVLDDTVFMYSLEEYVPTNNFTIYIPFDETIANPDLEVQVVDYVNKYRVAGTTFNTQIY